MQVVNQGWKGQRYGIQSLTPKQEKKYGQTKMLFGDTQKKNIFRWRREIDFFGGLTNLIKSRD